MKELSVEEKAKLYDEAIERANELKYVSDKDSLQCKTAEHIFPELKESEDEEIKEMLKVAVERTPWMQDKKEKCYEWLEAQGEQKPAWSEEDDRMIVHILGTYKALENMLDLSTSQDKNFRDNMNFERDWLSSLKDRVQPKVELTQLDKNILEAAIAFVEQNNHFNCWCGVDKHTVLSALHSLRPHNTWKPSDMQMHYLSWVANIKLGDSVVEQEVSKHLNELLEDLKKLKG